MKLRDKDTTPMHLQECFTKTYYYYSLNVYFRCFREIDLSVRLYEFDPFNNVRVNMNWLDIDIDDNNLNIDLNAKCRYCRNSIVFCNNIFPFYYCRQHGRIFYEKHIMYYAKQRDKESWFPVNVPNPYVPDNSECPYLLKYKKCIQLECSYAHSLVELEIWKFLSNNDINMQILAFHQQKLKYGNQIKCSGAKSYLVFERNKVLHEIINDGDINKFKEFIKYCNGDILSDYNEKNESILHVAVKNKNYEMIRLLLDCDELRDCLESSELSNCQYYSFINHQCAGGLTAFESLLTNNLNINENLEQIFKLFLECDDCEVEKALELCKQNDDFNNFERKLFERIYFEETC
jgi:hypothetical protein